MRIKDEKQNINKKRKVATTGVVILSIGLIVCGAFAALSDTLNHNETITIEWVDIVDGSVTNLALEDVSDVNNTPVEELTPGVTYELTGSLENDSTVRTNWTATNLTSTPGMNVTINDADGVDAPVNPNEAVDVSQFGITVTVDQTVTPSTDLNFTIEFNSVDAREDSVPPPAAISDIFPDAALAACVASDDELVAITGGDVNYVISADELNSITSLECTSDGIININGIQYMNNLTTLNLSYNNIADVTLLANLENLTSLNLSYNDINDVTPLANLTNLTYLNLGANQITNIDSLANLTNLTFFHVGNNQVSDISVVANFTNLGYLNLGINQIEDITPLANLNKVSTLYLGTNYVSDFSPLAKQPVTFMATTQDITLPDTTLGTPTPITIDGVNGEDLIIAFNTPGTYVNGELTWDNPGVNSLTYASTDGSITGTITQNVTP